MRGLVRSVGALIAVAALTVSGAAASPAVESSRVPARIWLTTVDNASHEVGRRAATTLLDRISDSGRPASEVLCEPRLEIRGTTAPPPSKTTAWL